MFKLVPDFKFKTFDELTVEILRSNGIKGVVLDIDNTLEPYENLLPGDHVKNWLIALKNAGISAAFVSNNNKERVERFNAELNLPAFYKAGKPFKKNVLRAMEIMGTSRESTLLMGDQVFTDVWAARNAGIMAAIVSPIRDKRDVFTRFKRIIEKPILKKYDKKKANKK